MNLVIALFWILIAYILGSIPTGYILGKIKGIDLTKVGSGGTGATNVLRNLGKGPAIVTLIVDILKGYIAVFLVIKFVPYAIVHVLVAMTVVLAHSKSIFLKFKGGKSSATGLGVLLALSPVTGITAFSVWLIVVFTSKISSLGSIVAIPLVPVIMYFQNETAPYVIFGVVVAIYIVLIRHRENIKRLLNGTEPKIGSNSKN